MTSAGAPSRETDEPSVLFGAVRSAAERAGEAIVAVAREGCEPWGKADGSPLTRADLAANGILVAALTALDPGTPIISEETPRAAGAPPARFWLIDPLDGTREFIAGGDDYTVNVALIEDGVPVLGVVHAPARGVTYAAAHGAGASRTDAAGTTAIRARTGGPLTVVVSRSHPGTLLGAFLAALPPHAPIALGSSLKLCLVADGTAQLYPRLGPTCWWDTAAAHAIVLEAGGEVTTLAGAPLRYAGEDVSNPPFVCSSLSRDAWAAAARAIAR